MLLPLVFLLLQQVVMPDQRKVIRLPLKHYTHPDCAQQPSLVQSLLFPTTGGWLYSLAVKQAAYARFLLMFLQVLQKLMILYLCPATDLPFQKVCAPLHIHHKNLLPCRPLVSLDQGTSMLPASFPHSPFIFIEA